MRQYRSAANAVRASFFAVTVAICAFTVANATLQATTPVICGGNGLSCPNGWDCCGDPAKLESQCFNPRDSQCCGAATSDFVCPGTRECCISPEGERKACCAPGNCTGNGTCGMPGPAPTPAPTSAAPTPVPTPGAPCPGSQQRCGEYCMPLGAACCDSTAFPSAYCDSGDICCVYGTGNVSCCPNTRTCNPNNGQCDEPTAPPTPNPPPPVTPVPCPGGRQCGTACMPEGARCCVSMSHPNAYCTRGNSCCFYDMPGHVTCCPDNTQCDIGNGQCDSALLS